VLLLDEPMAALDAKLRKEMRFELKRLQQTLGITFVLVTHDQEEALTMSDRLAVVHKGRLEQVDNPRSMYESPITRFVAEFIGTANFLPGKITQSQGGQVWVESSLGVFPAADPRSLLKVDDAVELTVRPERCIVSHDAGNAKSLQGDLESVVFLGSVTRLTVRLNDTVTFVAEKPTYESQGFTQGEKVYLSWDADASTALAAGAV
jgi:spermidine/putrescine transport system ATP-binding protein